MSVFQGSFMSTIKITAIMAALVAGLMLICPSSAHSAAPVSPPLTAKEVFDIGGTMPEERTPTIVWNKTIKIASYQNGKKITVLKRLNTQNPSKPVVDGSKAFIYNNKAYAPINAPKAVKAVIWAGNKINTLPYVWGGGHGSWNASGYDCSGSVSYALRGANLLNSPMTSGDLASWGKPGQGKWITIYANSGHVYMHVAGIRFDTSGANPSRWQFNLRSSDAYTLRHPDHL